MDESNGECGLKPHTVIGAADGEWRKDGEGQTGDTPDEEREGARCDEF